jgi:uncharacterized protein
MARKKAAAASLVRPIEEHLKLLKEIWRDKGVLQRHLQHSTIDELNDKGGTLLHVACSDTRSFAGSSDALVKLLLQAGADCNRATTSEGFTPLMLASTAAIASCLLDNGADIGRECTEGSMALHLACKNGQLAVVRVLLKWGAEQHILKRSTGCATALNVAFAFDEVEIIMLLLQHLFEQADFDINHPMLVLDQPLVCAAAEAGMCRVVEAALDHGAFINATGPDGTALLQAARAGHHDTVSLLCERGAEVNARSGSLQISGLEAAIVGGHVRVIKTLMKHGADINAVSGQFQISAVEQAALSRQCAALAVLLQAGAHFDAVVQYKCISSVCQHLEDAAAAEVVKALLPYCSKLNVPAVKAATALTYAVSQSKLQVARVLHAAGADVHYTAKGIGTAHLAAQSGSVALLKWLQTEGVDLRARNDSLEMPLHYACSSNKLDAARYLLDLPGAAADAHASGTKQQTPVYYAALSGADSIVQLLLQRGASIDVRSAGRSTPLMAAKTALVVKLLLAAGADATAVDSRHCSVLHYCATFGAAAGAICLLLKAGADPTAVDDTGSTAAHAAGMKGHFALEALLSRAADDYRRKHAALATVSDTSSGSSTIGGISSSSNYCGSSSGGSNSYTSRRRSSNSSSTGTSEAAAVTDYSSVESSTSSSTAAAAATAGTDEHSTHEQPADALLDSAMIEQTQQQQPKAQKAKHPCANCSKHTTKRCRRCAAVYYCSVECQKACFANALHRAQCEAKAAAA